MFNKFFGSGEWTVIGLMSGTSLDGLDAARVRFERRGDALEDWELLAYEQRPIPPVLRGDLEALVLGEARSAAVFARLHVDLARAFAELILEAFPQRPAAELIAFPGQTLHHDPDGVRLSFQLGSPAVLAALTGIPTVGEFRLPDVLAGGQGAPLVPLADALLHRDAKEYRALLNLGGIANLTLLPPAGSGEELRAWDVGPGNTLLDAASRLALGEPMDRDGGHAARGHVHAASLERWLEHEWFARPAPKSTGRELFGRELLGPGPMGHALEELGAEDLLATLAELSVEAVARSLEREAVDALYVAGGGARNAHLMARLSARLAPMPVATTEALGLPVEAKEAVDFALLGLEAAAGRPVSLPAVTGASRPGWAGLFSPGGLLQEH